METITISHKEYLEKILKKENVSSLTTLARMIKINPSTLNRFGKKGGQETLGARTIKKLEDFSGIPAPTTFKNNIPILDEMLMKEAILDIFEASAKDEEELPLERKIRFGIELYKKRIKDQINQKTSAIKGHN
jgi:ppGpp synthetase/RelA/SpoT-type nucleotidyltranferase